MDTGESGNVRPYPPRTCPVRTRCRHISAVMDMRHAEAMVDEDHDGTEVIERTEL